MKSYSFMINGRLGLLFAVVPFSWKVYIAAILVLPFLSRKRIDEIRKNGRSPFYKKTVYFLWVKEHGKIHPKDWPTASFSDRNASKVFKLRWCLINIAADRFRRRRRC